MRRVFQLQCAYSTHLSLNFKAMKFQFLIIFSILICSQLKSQNAYLSIQADVSDATVFINNIEKGKVPYETMVSPGTYSIRIFKSVSVDEEYYYSEKITVKSNDIKKINATLERRYTEANKKKKEEEKRKIEEKRKNISYSSITDTRDGHTYKTIVIGNQTWMAENLAFRVNGCCTFNNESSISKYGFLYNWQTAQNVCPNGWHLPSDSEWTQLTDYLGGGNQPGNKMKDISGWEENTNSNNISGFSAMPGGFGAVNYNRIEEMGKAGYWWTSTSYDTKFAWYRRMWYTSDEVDREYAFWKVDGASVRCVKN